MDRGASPSLLSWLLVPAAGLLVVSALGLPRQPYTGLALRGDEVAAVVPESPGARAGIYPGDRLEARAPSGGGGESPLAAAAPGSPLALTRIRGASEAPVWLVPDVLPDGERRMMAAFLVVASGFVLLGGWVWSERRDRLTRVFFLLCLAFAWLLSPVPRFASPALSLLEELIYTGATLFLPALFIHFFALFPGPQPAGRRLRLGIRAGYAVALTLLALGIATLAQPASQGGDATRSLLQIAAAVWFAAGLIVALTLFARSYLRAESADARRRLRVALAGTVLGAGPLAALIAFRNLSPGTPVPGERWTVVMTLLVPLSFAWGAVVHRIFDFRVALRAATVVGLAALAAVATYSAGEWLSAAWWPGRSAGIGGGALAFLALTASVAGPARRWLTSLGERLVPNPDGWSPEGVAEEATRAPGARGIAELLGRACAMVSSTLKLDRCAAVLVEGGTLRILDANSDPGHGPDSARHFGALELAPDLLERLSQHDGPVAVDEAGLGAAERESLELAGVAWVLPLGAEAAPGPAPAALLLGQRLAGPWLSLREAQGLASLAARLRVEIENVALRREARSRGALDRELEEARSIQAHRLPRRLPVYPTLDCAAVTLASEAVGGDYYDLVEHGQRSFTLAVGDAAGKGVPAALVLSGVQARFRDAAIRHETPGGVLASLNHDLARLDQPEKFFGMVCARVEVRSALLRFANAGLTPPLIRRRGGGFEEQTGGGLLLGVREEADYQDAVVELNLGDLAVVYTDGLTEARRGGELFGVERLCAVLDQHAHRRAADILEELLASVRAFASDPLDDLTVVVLKQLTRPVRPGTASRPSRAREIPLKLAPAAADVTR